MNPTSANAGEAISGMAVLGKTALVLIALVALILLCGWLLRRLSPGQGLNNPALKVIASRAVGPRERVVLMEIEGTWLLLGVGGGNVRKLHQLPAPPTTSDQPEHGSDNFASRFARALGQNLSGRGNSQ